MKKQKNKNRQINIAYRVQSSIAILVVIITASFSGCNKDEKKWVTEYPSDKDSIPTQYDIPYDKVPNTSDIVMYEVNIRAFSSTGDLAGVTENLDSVKKLGINVIWLMPIYPLGELKSIGSPYSIRDYTGVDPELGTLEDLRLLVKEAHQRDMAVILDWVANHTSWDHSWISNKSWYAQDDNGNIIHPPGTNWEDVAELDYSNTDMREEMIKALKYWILEANVDGYRCDFAHGVPVDFWKEAITELRNIPNRDIILFAESEDKLLLNAGFDMIFGWNYYSKLKEVFNENISATELISTNSSDYSGIPSSAHFVRWITNHDEHAWQDTPIQIFKNEAGSLAAFVLSTYISGVPLIYSGQEVGLTEKLPFFTTDIRKIEWSHNYKMKEEYKEILNFYNTSNTLRNGEIENYSSENVAAFKRVKNTEEVLVLANVREYLTEFQIPEELLNTTWTDALNDTVVQLTDNLKLSSFSYLILKN